MRRYRVVISPFAQDNIREAYEWFMAENAAYAATWLGGVQERILGLETFPESHAVAPESDACDCEIRQLLYGRGTPWRIFFTIDGLTVHVLHVRHGSRDYWRPTSDP